MDFSELFLSEQLELSAHATGSQACSGEFKGLGEYLSPPPWVVQNGMKVLFTSQTVIGSMDDPSGLPHDVAPRGVKAGSSRQKKGGPFEIN
jgi:hypothetical protein